jgi:hypothetical protein
MEDQVARQLMEPTPATDLPVDVFTALSPDAQVPPELRVLSERAAQQKAAELKAANVSLVDASGHRHESAGILVEKSESFFDNTVCPSHGWFSYAQCHWDEVSGWYIDICLHDWGWYPWCEPYIAVDHGYNQHWQSGFQADRLYAYNGLASLDPIGVHVHGNNGAPPFAGSVSSSIYLQSGYWGYGYWWYYPGGSLGSHIMGHLKDNAHAPDDWEAGLTVHFYDKPIQ